MRGLIEFLLAAIMVTALVVAVRPLFYGKGNNDSTRGNRPHRTHRS
jgi:hypothetical protein